MMSTVTKVTLHGPAPYGGSFTAPIEDPGVNRLLGQGWTEVRRWEVSAERRGQCGGCGDEWIELGAIVVCPECGSLEVVEVKR